MSENLSHTTWVFAHGSLMFDPGFDPTDMMPGRAWGWERRFGQPSVRNWGRAAAPAPTCSLTRGDLCDGVLLGLPSGQGRSILSELVRREANEPVTLTVTSEYGDVAAFSWLMSDAWADLGVDELAERGTENVEDGGGPKGDAWQYASGVQESLAAHGSSDPLVDSYISAFRPALMASGLPVSRFDGASPE